MCTNKFSMAGVYLRESRVDAVVDVDVVKVLKSSLFIEANYLAKASSA